MSRPSDSNSTGKTVPGVFNWKMVRKALRAAEEGVYCWNIESGEIFYTEQCLRMMGLPFDEWAPNIFTDPEHTIHEDDRQFFANEVQKYLGRPTTAPLRVEIRLLNLHSRGWRWVRVNGLLERDKNKKISSWSAFGSILRVAKWQICTPWRTETCSATSLTFCPTISTTRTASLALLWQMKPRPAKWAYPPHQT